MGPRYIQFRSYGAERLCVQLLVKVFLILLVSAFAPQAGLAQTVTKPLKIVVLGDSLSAGYGLADSDTFPSKLEAKLKAKGFAVTIANAGVSGDTASGGLDRLDWSVPADTQAVIVELGANDALRGLDPQLTEKALDEILRRLKDRRIPVLFAGMKAPRNMGADYAKAFDSIYPKLASKYAVVFYPFFLDGVATDGNLNQSDGMHPNADGVDVIVKRIMPKVDELIARVQKAH